MKKYILTLILLTAATISNAQWKNEESDNGFDPKFRYSTVDEQTNSTRWLKIEKYKDTQTLLLVYLGFVCTENPTIELSYKMDTGWCKFKVLGMTSSGKKKVYISDNIEKDFGDAFAKSSLLKIRVDDDYCGTNVYSFSMAGSKAALDWVHSLKKK